MRVGAVLVHFHTPELVRPAVEALAVAADRAGAILTTVVVDNGSTAEGRESLRAAASADRFVLVDAGANLGYAGGVNLGVRVLPEVDAYVLMNPDVLVEEGALVALLAELERGAAVAGPRFFWDELGAFQLPMTERYHLADEWRRAWAAWSQNRATAARRAWRRHAYRFFSATAAATSFELSGALLVVSSAAWRAVGPFDEAYALYFEETDWLARTRAAGLRAVYVPEARALHLYAQSTPEGGAHERFAASRRRFRQRRWGRIFTGAFERLERFLARRANSEPAAEQLPPEAVLPEDASAAFLEISPSPWGFPAASRSLPAGLEGGQLAIPANLRTRIAAGPYWLRTLDREGNERSVFRVVMPFRHEPQAKSLSPIV